MTLSARTSTALLALLATAACSRPDPQPRAAAAPPPAAPAPPAASAPPANAPAPAPPAAAASAGQDATAAVARLNDAAPSSDAASASSKASAPANTTGEGEATSVDPVLFKAQVLLARAFTSPGVIDGRPGSNFVHALGQFERMHDLPQTEGRLTPQVWQALTGAGGAPVAAAYTVTAQDAAGPYYPAVGEDLVAMAKLPQVGYARASEALAERFHMDEDALKALNPGADFGRAGAVLVVAQVGPLDLPRVDHVEVDKAHAAVRAYNREGTEIAFMPATVGSTDRPSPTGTHKVKGVAHNPKYTYDPKKLTWGPKDQGKFVVPAGPNNPVGAVWIDLDAPSYGLHGTPEPKEIGKTASHGCVRMTNWDALQLASAVRPGVVVRFVNSRES